MNILHLYKDYFPVEGGIENHIKQLAEAQAARGHAVSVLVTSQNGDSHVETINGVRVFFAARLAHVSSTPLSLAMFQVLARERPDIVHMQFPYPWGEIGDYFFGRARRRVLTYQSDIVRQKYLRVLYAPLMQRVLAHVDRIIATSPNYVASSSVLSQFRNKCTVIPMGIHPQPFLCQDRQGRIEVRTRLGIGQDVPLLLSVGLLRYYKGLQYMLEAMPTVPDAHWAIVGNGPMENEWRSLAQRLGLSERVHFVGELANPDVRPYYAACDVFVFPSSERSEAFGIVQLEAMAAGKPVVCTELGTGTSFVNADGETGFVVPAREPGALAAAVRRLLDDAALRKRMGAAGRARVLKEFTLEKMVDRVMEVYDRIAE